MKVTPADLLAINPNSPFDPEKAAAMSAAINERYGDEITDHYANILKLVETVGSAEAAVEATMAKVLDLNPAASVDEQALLMWQALANRAARELASRH